jgi:hypothetical protein
MKMQTNFIKRVTTFVITSILSQLSTGAEHLRDKMADYGEKDNTKAPNN